MVEEREARSSAVVVLPTPGVPVTRMLGSVRAMVVVGLASGGGVEMRLSSMGGNAAALVAPVRLKERLVLSCVLIFGVIVGKIPQQCVVENINSMYCPNKNCDFCRM